MTVIEFVLPFKILSTLLYNLNTKFLEYLWQCDYSCNLDCSLYYPGSVWLAEPFAEARPWNWKGEQGVHKAAFWQDFIRWQFRRFAGAFLTHIHREYLKKEEKYTSFWWLKPNQKIKIDFILSLDDIFFEMHHCDVLPVHSPGTYFQFCR